MGAKLATVSDAVAVVESGMTVGIGGWGSRRKPMALVRALARGPATDLTLVTYGGPDVGLLAAAGKVRKLVSGFVSLDSVPLEPHFRAARQRGEIEFAELDEGMLQWGLLAAAHRLPFLPIRAGLGSDVPATFAGLRTVTSPYDDGEELLAMPALSLDVAFVHANRADAAGNAAFLGPDPYFDDLFCLAARHRVLSCERVVETAELTKEAPVQALRINRMMVDAVVETPNGAHFTSCVPDYDRDEAFQRAYVTAAGGNGSSWAAFQDRYLAGDEAAYQAAVRADHGPARGAGDRTPETQEKEGAR
ncbi:MULTISPECIES: CoA transferase subunit A [Pseudofrankia]|uniref:CoA transferase subunit A n=1 Tax=Pseudofrankia TaxID=2994363 RepID=UPI000234D4A4|nr:MULTISPECIES: CoA-transferase [Pseudofrankia]